jgi:hypothetical protein
MSSALADYSTSNVSPALLSDITEAIQSVKSYGSIELYVQEGVVTQITVRQIKKTTASKSARKKG